MRHRVVWIVLVLAILVLSNCHLSSTVELPDSSSISMDSIQQVELGHLLFFDKKLSKTSQKSCATCHNPIFSFTDGYRRGRGIYGNIVKHNTPSLLNLDDQKYFNWSDSTIHSIYDQMKGPLFNTTPEEMGLSNVKEEVLNRFNSDSLYQSKWKVFGGEGMAHFSYDNIRKSIAAYISTLTSRKSNYDMFQTGKKSSRLTPNAMKGKKLFFSSKFGCTKCHGGIDFDTPSMGSHYSTVLQEGTLTKHRIPSLRNVVLTSPYFHDGSIKSLRKAIYHMSTSRDHPKDFAFELKDDRLTDTDLTNNEVEYIIDFLYELSDTSYLRDSHFRDPFIYY